MLTTQPPPVADRAFLRLAEEEYTGLPSDVSDTVLQYDVALFPEGLRSKSCFLMPTFVP